MAEGLIALLIAILVIGIIAAIVLWLVDLLPIDARFKQIAKALVMVIAVVAILVKALPLLGVPV